MDDLRNKLAHCSKELRALQRIQESYDEVGWMIKTPPSAKLRHISLHLSMTVGSVAALCEAQEHYEFSVPAHTGEEVIDKLADNQIYIGQILIAALQLGNLAGVDLGVLIHETYASNARRYAPESEFARL